MASAGPYASLHLAPDKQAHQHPTTVTGRMPFLPPNQQRQSTEGKHCRHWSQMRPQVAAVPVVCVPAYPIDGMEASSFPVIHLSVHASVPRQSHSPTACMSPYSFHWLWMALVMCWAWFTVLAVHGPMVWNSLPDDFCAQQDYESFRHGLKTWLFSRY